MSHARLRTLLATCLPLAIAACGGSRMGGFPMSAPERPAPMYASMPAGTAMASQPSEFNTERYKHIQDNDFLAAASHPLSTFSVDVDTASYANVRRFLTSGQKPPADAVRIEELLNYFDYQYEAPASGLVAVHSEIADCPWHPQHRLLRIGLKARELEAGRTPPRNLVFLIDVSGSMDEPAKLPLVTASLKRLTSQLSARDHVAIVVYAGAAGVVLPPTSGDQKERITGALDKLKAGGSTNGGEGILQAYKLARQNFDVNGVNRVILATDGDFNVGTTSEGELVRLIEEQRSSGVYLNVLGVGTGNYNDSSMEALADKGNGVYSYLDSMAEAEKVLVKQAGANLVTVARDVKIQIEFNPKRIAEYRLIGYEDRVLQAKDFKDDKKDAGEMGAGHTVTTLYELVPVGAAPVAGATDPLKYQGAAPTPAANTSEIATIKLRFKAPGASESQESSYPVVDEQRVSWQNASTDFRFAASVAAFGMMLRGSAHRGHATWGLVQSMAEGARGSDKEGYRKEFIGLVGSAARLVPAPPVAVAK